MKIKPNHLWIVAVLLGWAFDLLFWKQDTGLNFALFSTLGLLGGFGLLLAHGIPPARRSLWLLIPIAFFASVTFLRQEPLTIFLAYTLTLFSIVLLTSTYSDGKWMEYNMPGYFSRFFRLIGNMFALPQRFIRETEKIRPSLPVIPILRGLLIALPIVTFFTLLLASADAIFNQKLAEQFQDFNLLESILRVFIILACAYLLAGIFLHTASQNSEETASIGKSLLRRQPLGFTEAAIVLGSVSVLFLLFVVIQFQYFFGGQANIGVEGFTYSQYARRGFSELITVAFFSLVLILGLNAVTRRENETQRSVHIGLNTAIVAEVLVMLVSAYQRLMLAIDWHGFSRLRIYPRVFMVWLGILLVAIIVLEILRRERYFALAFVLASLGFAASLTLVNVDASIMSHNLTRLSEGKNLNVPDLSSLSTDALPALVDAFQSPGMSQEHHEGIGAILTCYIHTDVMTSSDDWRSFNFSRWRAKRLLETVEPLLTEYRYNDKKSPSLARTPNGVYYECWRIQE
jgi:hypothetical protein